MKFGIWCLNEILIGKNKFGFISRKVLGVCGWYLCLVLVSSV